MFTCMLYSCQGAMQAAACLTPANRTSMFPPPQTPPSPSLASPTPTALLASFGCLPFLEDGSWDEQLFDAVQVPMHDDEGDGSAVQFDPVQCGKAAAAAGYFLAGFVGEAGDGGGGGR